mmetsp:Transcript_9815/g.9479  ORF Transcript_9815/g.9479 Transcript_9815/m.9479 type:complete len:129 (-) Transcript_9815:157-543(-)|eukprot:CAMPEP_0197833364 /NCGR_PEP_ID=MMETSP1437-20131217/18809_1 /TAXON_ID=49252 ORGANISM="Eucampia antarctica, Strain CCMP1452" /NCGR_SAMPLE_ID=MMETSP1437 /ASSEMBLY_ACC=CAM_ASM_001096 /LENGTH=128 /DNA_ID=CAMNT_0043437373 /DNA_START=51 /DNA_END=437 /DNA_ORIENTATION=+
MMRIVSFLSLLLVLVTVRDTTSFSPAFVTSTRGAVSSTSLDERRTGTVKWFNTEKGFGFIVPDDGEGDVFVHQTSINTEGFRSLADGEKVEFETITDDNGKTKADDVTGPDGEAVQGAPFRPSSDFGY